MGLQATCLHVGRCAAGTHMEQAIKTDWERTPVAEVRKQIISDYKWAQQYIPTEASLQGRITKGAVQTLLAEMYLTIGKPDSALYWCDQVINNTAYKLTQPDMVLKHQIRPAVLSVTCSRKETRTGSRVIKKPSGYSSSSCSTLLTHRVHQLSRVRGR